MSPSSLPPIRKGTRLTDFGTFDLTVEGLAQGGMGMVVWGPDQGFGGQWRAAKLVRPDQGTSQHLRDAFEREALAWCRLWPHQTIIAATALTRLPGWGNLPILILEYAPGGTLRQMFQQAHQPGRTLTLEAAFAWGQHVAAALAYLHTPDPGHERPAPLVHADLKPENILLGANGWAKLTDLGLSRVLAQTEEALASPLPKGTPSEQRQRMATALQTGQGKSSAQPLGDADGLVLSHTQRFGPPTGADPPGRGAVVGAVPYMPPEQWEGIEAVVPASDVYALGVVLYELFAGRAGWPHQPTQPGAAGWREAHARGPRWRLGDEEVGALEAGPLGTLAQQAGGSGRAEAERVLRHVEEVVRSCLEREASERPRAEEVQQVLGELAEQVGLKRQQEARAKQTPSNEASYWNNLGTTLGHLGQQEERLRLSERARDLDPEDWKRWAQVGAALAELGRLTEALEAYAEAERRVPERETQRGYLAMLANNRGMALDSLERYAEAVTAYRQSVELNPEDAPAWNNLAVVFGQWSRKAGLPEEEREALLREAMNSVEQALVIEPNSSQAQRLRQAILAELGRVKGERAQGG